MGYRIGDVEDPLDDPEGRLEVVDVGENGDNESEL